MKRHASAYQQLVSRVLRDKFLEQGFTEVRLRDCISYEVLFRKGDLWFGTSWDYRDRYLDLDFGHLYWMRDVMPRVVIVGHYASFCAELKRLDKTRADYLEAVVTAVERSLDAALKKYLEVPALAETLLGKLRPLLIEKVTDEQLAPHEA